MAEPPTFSARERAAVAGLALASLLIPNGIFVWYIFCHPDVVRAAFTNPVSAVFIAEAFILMILFAWLLKRVAVRQPTGFQFVILSLIGSLGFSVPVTLLLLLRGKKDDRR